jgi:urease accessory protein
MEGFYLGLLHPFDLMPQVLLLLALALAVAQRLPLINPLFLAFLVGTLVGILLVPFVDFDFDVELALLFCAILVGLIVAGSVRIPRSILLIIGMATGALSGYASFPGPGSLAAMVTTATGTFLGICLVVVGLAGGLAAIQQKTGWNWLPIAVRIAGSWISATGLLVAALVWSLTQ